MTILGNTYRNFYLILSFALLGFFCPKNACFAQADSDSLLADLSSLLKKEDVYVAQKQYDISKIENRLTQLDSSDFLEKYRLYGQLYDAYQAFKFDSAFYCASRRIEIGYRLGELQKVDASKVELAFVLMSAGMYKETFDSLRTVRVANLTDTVKLDYYSLLARANYDLGDFNKDNFYNPRYTLTAGLYIDSARALAAKGSYDDLYLASLKNLKSQNRDVAHVKLGELIKRENLSSHQFAIVASTLSFVELTRGDTTQAINLLAKAAMRDIKTATKETSALTSLAELLYRRGQIEYAYQFINASLGDAELYGARQRKVYVGNILPLIASSKLLHVEGQRSKLLKYAIGITLFVLLIAIFVVIMLRQNKKIKQADRELLEANNNLMKINTQLQEAQKIKEEYIGFYFSINSVYLEKIEKFKKSIEQKLSTRKYDEIEYVINTINLKKERANLYRNFDKVFIKLFPDFVAKFNAYFLSENQIKLENEEILNTELRIFALTRMGISEPEKQAAILGYSINTIYSYKNRVKSKSIVANDEFEQKIMEIKSI